MVCLVLFPLFSRTKALHKPHSHSPMAAGDNHATDSNMGLVQRQAGIQNTTALPLCNPKLNKLEI